MDQQNIDRLFREKLDHFEVEPSTQAWSKVEKQIRPQKTPVLYWVAASVSLLLISWMVWPTSEQATPLTAEVNHPVQMEVPEFSLPVGKKENEEEKAASQKAFTNSAQPQLASNQTQNVKDEKEEELVRIEEIDPKTMIAEVELEEPIINEKVIEEPVVEEYKAVKITYIASASNAVKLNEQKTDSTTALKKFIAFAEKIDPGDMLADIKTAKDNLLNGGLKGKKDRNSL